MIVSAGGAASAGGGGSDRRVRRSMRNRLPVDDGVATGAAGSVKGTGWRGFGGVASGASGSINGTGLRVFDTGVAGTAGAFAGVTPGVSLSGSSWISRGRSAGGGGGEFQPLWRCTTSTVV